MNTVINFKTDKKVKAQAQNIAQAMGLNLSDVLNIYLRGFVKSKEIYISLNKDESSPSHELMSAAKEAREDYKSGKLKGLKNVDALVTHLR